MDGFMDDAHRIDMMHGAFTVGTMQHTLLCWLADLHLHLHLHLHAKIEWIYPLWALGGGGCSSSCNTQPQSRRGWTVDLGASIDRQRRDLNVVHEN
jgi:hypothetical protein